MKKISSYASWSLVLMAAFISINTLTSRAHSVNFMESASADMENNVEQALSADDPDTIYCSSVIRSGSGKGCMICTYNGNPQVVCPGK